MIFGIISFSFIDLVAEKINGEHDHSHTHDSHSHTHDSHDHKDEKKKDKAPKKSDKPAIEKAPQASGLAFLTGDFLHNFTDGLAIGSAFTISKNEKETG